MDLLRTNEFENKHTSRVSIFYFSSIKWRMYGRAAKEKKVKSSKCAMNYSCDWLGIQKWSNHLFAPHSYVLWPHSSDNQSNNNINNNKNARRITNNRTGNDVIKKKCADSLWESVVEHSPLWSIHSVRETKFVERAMAMHKLCHSFCYLFFFSYACMCTSMSQSVENGRVKEREREGGKEQCWKKTKRTSLTINIRLITIYIIYAQTRSLTHIFRKTR